MYGLLDSGAPFYDVYETSDGEHMAVGALEPEFYAALLEGLGLTGDDMPDRYDPTQWPSLRAVLAERFSQRTQQAWTAVFEGTDACVTPVLPMTRAATHPQLAARGTYVEHHGVVQPAPAPRFSRTVPTLTTAPSEPVDVRDVLRSWGVETA